MHLLFRIPNLLIVALTQYLLQYLVLIPVLEIANIPPLLNHFHFFLLTLTTVLIAAGGYVINDVLDHQIDLINKPEKVIVGKIITKKQALIIYWVLNFSGAFFAWHLAGFVNNYYLFLIYPLAILLLYFYSKYFKKMPLLGNMVVSFFCAGVAGIILFSERAAYQQLFTLQPHLANKITWIFSGYILFAFLSTFMREIIKDVEDLEGDTSLRLNTFPILYGLKNSKILTGLIAITMLILMMAGSYWLLQNEEITAAVFALLGICLPLFLIVIFLINSKIKEQFSKLSQLTKILMLSGLILLIIIWKF